jgi:hypothetical protein
MFIGGHTLILPFVFAVRLVRKNRSNIHELVVAANAGNKTIFVSGYVEHRQRFSTLGGNAGGVWIILPKLLKALPLGVDRRLAPMPKPRFGIGMPLPKLPQQFEANHPHLDILSQIDPFVNSGMGCVRADQLFKVEWRRAQQGPPEIATFLGNSAGLAALGATLRFYQISKPDWA